MSTQARGLQNFISDLRNAKSKVSNFRVNLRLIGHAKRNEGIYNDAQAFLLGTTYIDRMQVSFELKNVFIDLCPPLINSKIFFLLTYFLADFFTGIRVRRKSKNVSTKN